MLLRIFLRRLHELKNKLGVKNGINEHEQKTNLDRGKALKLWVDNTSIQEIFDWFDAVEKIDVTTSHARQI